MAFNRCNAGSVGCRLRVLATSDRSASLEVSRFIRRALSQVPPYDQLQPHKLSRSSSRTLPISCIVWRRRAWMRQDLLCSLYHMLPGENTPTRVCLPAAFCLHLEGLPRSRYLRWGHLCSLGPLLLM